MRCVPYHVVAPTPRRVVIDAPPFETIAKKFALQPEMPAFAILDPHPRMNVALSRREVEDIAAYINTLANNRLCRRRSCRVCANAQLYRRINRSDGPAWRSQPAARK
jgi:hypothetical protein